jgi:hypothetical protein
MPTLEFRGRKWWKSEWDLFYHERILASLVVEGWGHGSAEATIGGKKYTLLRNGWSGSKLTVRDASGATVSESEPQKWWKTAMMLSLDGRKYTLTTTKWCSRYIALDESGAEVVAVKARWWKAAGEVETRRSPEDETMLLLACILFYRMKIAEQNTAVIAAAGGGAAASGS